MAKEIWIKADVYGWTREEGQGRPLARCGLHHNLTDMVWAHPDAVKDIGNLECWAKGIINSSNTALVSIKGGYAPLGTATGPAKVVFGMQVREIRNDISRDKPCVFLQSKDQAQKMCLLKRRFCASSYDMADILIANGLKPEALDARKIAHLASVAEAFLMRRLGEMVEIPDNVK